jgi:WG containing repeat
MKSLGRICCCILASSLSLPCAYGQSRSSEEKGSEAAKDETRLYPFRSAANGKIGYIDGEGKIKIAPGLTDCGSIDPGPEFSEGRAITGCVPLGYIDASGKTVIAEAFDEARPFSGGLAAVKGTGGKWGYINRDGKFAVSPQFQEAGQFSEGLAAVANDDGEWGYINPSARVQIPFGFEEAGIFSQGLARVEVGRKFGYLDKTGKLAIQPQFKDARAFSQGLAAVLGDSWHYIGRDGKPAFPRAFAQAGEFSEELAPVQLEANSPFGYIDHNGAFALQPQFERAFPFKNGLALVYFSVRNNSKGVNLRHLLYGYIDRTGRKIFSSEIPYVQTDGSRSIGSGGQAYIPMSPVTIESVPAGAKVYLVPLDDWETDKSIENEREKLLRYLQSEYTPLRDYQVIRQVYRVLLEINGKRVTRQFDVNEFSTKHLQIDFQKEQ